MPLKATQSSYVDPVIQFQSDLMEQGRNENKLAPKMVARGVGVVALPILELFEAFNLTLRAHANMINGSFQVLSKGLPKSQKDSKEAFGKTPGFKDALSTALKAIACYFGIVVAPTVSLVSPSVCVKEHRRMGIASSKKNIPEAQEILPQKPESFPQEQVIPEKKPEIIPEKKAEIIKNPKRVSTNRPKPQPKTIEIPKDASLGFQRIIGQDALKAELNSKIIGPYKAMQNANSSWVEQIANDVCAIRPQQSLILYGPTGCGKTTVAEAIAEEMGVKFISIAISDLGSTYQHGTINNLKKVMEDAAANAPCVLFFDEFETLVKDRAKMEGDKADAHEVVCEFLIQLEKVQKNSSVFVIAATNHLDKIDPAIMRSGRFNMKIEIPNPDLDTRKKLFVEMMKDRQFEGGDLSEIVAQKTEGWNVADFVNLHERINLRLQPLIVQAINALKIGDSPNAEEMGKARKCAESVKVTQAILEEEIAAIAAAKNK